MKQIEFFLIDLSVTRSYKSKPQVDHLKIEYISTSEFEEPLFVSKILILRAKLSFQGDD